MAPERLALRPVADGSTKVPARDLVYVLHRSTVRYTAYHVHTTVASRFWSCQSTVPVGSIRAKAGRPTWHMLRTSDAISTRLCRCTVMINTVHPAERVECMCLEKLIVAESVRHALPSSPSTNISCRPKFAPLDGFRATLHR